MSILKPSGTSDITAMLTGIEPLSLLVAGVSSVASRALDCCTCTTNMQRDDVKLVLVIYTPSYKSGHSGIEIVMQGSNVLH